jgi:serine-type D-Ala-D-Ala carboxypeptidase/endopeptidase
MESAMSRRCAVIAACAAFTSFFAAGAAHAMTDAELQAAVAKRLHGDRTGACFATAVIEKDQVSRAYVCADGKEPAERIDANTAFEIGSVTIESSSTDDTAICGNCASTWCHAL